MIKRIYVCLLCLVFSILTLTACSSKTLNTYASELSNSYSRKITETSEISEDFITSMSDFSLTLFKKIVTNDKENDLVSPLSASLCLAMLENGADGETKSQMEQTFGMNIDDLNKSLYAFTSSLYTSKDCKLNIADSIWIRDNNNLHVNEDFLQANADWYNAQIYKAPFDDSTVKDINNWCNYYTDGLIDNVINEIDVDTVMYLINALVFDAKWQNKYENKNVRDGVFNNYNKDKSNVKMLLSEETIYLSSDSAKGFSKNYSGNQYSFVALLPNEDIDIYDYIKTLDGKEWMNIWKTKKNASVDVLMPEFKYETKMKLNETLKAMGMKDMFTNNANFSKLGSLENGNIYVNQIEQKTYIQVDRNGTKAAAVTIGEAKNSSEKLIINLNRPFVYSIVDNKTGLPIFIGAVKYL